MVWPFRKKSLSVPQDNRGWFTIFESFTGAFQQDVTVDREQVLAYHANFSCQTLIASDISKLRQKLVKKQGDIWVEVPLGKKYAVIANPNNYQNRIQFIESWLHSKLARGNTYVLKERDREGNVVAEYVLCPDLVKPLVSDAGEVFYELSKDNMAGVKSQIIVPASEIIHDRFNCLYHPLIGLSPIYANGLAATQGLNIQKNSAFFFKNMSRPSGVLQAPGEIKPEVAAGIKTQWEANYGGKNIGRVAILGNDLKYAVIAATAEESQMIDQLRLSSEIVCATYHVPKYKVVGDAPTYNNIEALEQQYYSQCLQHHIESIELCQEEGLGIPDDMGIEFDLDGLLRMDTATQMTTFGTAVDKTILAPNEVRKKLNYPPVPGGDSPLSQQQNYSLAALAKRDAKEDPFAGKSSDPTPAPAGNDNPPSKSEGETYARKSFGLP